MSTQPRCTCSRCTIRGLMGPAVITTLGVLFLFSEMWHGVFSFGHTFPVLFIVIGAILLASAKEAADPAANFQLTPRCETAHIWRERTELRSLPKVVVRISLFSREIAMNKPFLIAGDAAALEMANATAGKLPACVCPELARNRRASSRSEG